MSVYQNLLARSCVKPTSRIIPTGLLLLDRMIGGIPLGGVTVLLGECQHGMLMFMKSVVKQCYEFMPSKYVGLIDFQDNTQKETRSIFWDINAKTFPDLWSELFTITDDDPPVFCLSAKTASIATHTPSSDELQQLQQRFNAKTENGLVLYLDEQAGVPRSLIDAMIMRANVVLKFDMNERGLQNNNNDRPTWIPRGVRIIAVKRPLSMSPIRTGIFPFVNGGLSDAMSVFYYMLERGEITECRCDGSTTYYCGANLELKKFTQAEWKESFDDVRPLLLRNL